MKAAEEAGEPAPVGLGHTHLAESPWIMTLPVGMLALLAIFVGFLVNPTIDVGGIDKHAFADFVVAENESVFEDHEAAVHAGSEPEFHYPIAIISSALAVTGLALAYLMYIRGAISPARVGARFPRVYTLLSRKYYMDELYEGRVVVQLFYRRLARATAWVDGAWFDNVSVQLSVITDRVGRGLAQVQNGQAQTYAVMMAGGLILALAAYLAWGG